MLSTEICEQFLEDDCPISFVAGEIKTNKKWTKEKIQSYCFHCKYGVQAAQLKDAEKQETIKLCKELQNALAPLLPEFAMGLPWSAEGYNLALNEVKWSLTPFSKKNVENLIVRIPSDMEEYFVEGVYALETDFSKCYWKKCLSLDTSNKTDSVTNVSEKHLKAISFGNLDQLLICRFGCRQKSSGQIHFSRTCFIQYNEGKALDILKRYRKCVVEQMLVLLPSPIVVNNPLKRCLPFDSDKNSKKQRIEPLSCPLPSTIPSNSFSPTLTNSSEYPGAFLTDEEAEAVLSNTDPPLCNNIQELISLLQSDSVEPLDLNILETTQYSS